jgi:transposase
MTSNLKTIKEWLLINEISFDDNLNKKQLLEIVKRNPRKPCYYVDDIITKFGCHPLRLPPYCCDFNAIEKIWNTWKQIVGHKNFNFKKLEEFKQYLSDSLKEITPSTWGATVRQVVREIESTYYQKFNIFHIPNESEHNCSINFVCN